MKPIIAALVAALTVCLLAWLLGFDFDKRGLAAFTVAIYALFFAIVVYIDAVVRGD
jgi:hypothetical protein